MLDVLLLVPMSSNEGLWIDAFTRRTVTARIYRPLERARGELERYIGRPLGFRTPDGAPIVDGESIRDRSHRTLTAVALADVLEREGLEWRAIDPPEWTFARWRRELAKYRESRPKVVAVSTTYGVDIGWFVPFCAILRRVFPDATIVVGGAAYATSAETYLSLDADVFCVGEGEVRLPQIVRAVQGGAALDSIPGLYLRRQDGKLRYTGSPPELPLAKLRAPDWWLSRRIDPPVDPEEQLIWYQLETLRGCHFKCQFCTYTTLTQYQPQKAAHRAERIMRMGSFGNGMLYLTDATASYPVPDWRETLELLVAKGGAPLPIGAFTRLPDLDEETVALMARANVRWVFIGLDSGDTGILRAMKKGTRLDQVSPAMTALARHGIGAHVSCIFGFPGETPDSASATRDLVGGLNDGFEGAPPAFVYNAEPWRFQDLAPLAARAVPAAPDICWSCDRVLDMYIALSRRAQAPVSLLTPYAFRIATGDPRFAVPPRRYVVHRFLKAMERGVALFLERELSGTVPNAAVLRETKAQILAHLPPRRARPVQDFARELMRRGRAPFERRLDAEWLSQVEQKSGPLTRCLLAVSYARAFGDLRGARSALTQGAWPNHAHPVTETLPGKTELREKTVELITLERRRNEKRRAVGASE
jgi:hypothetical protein